MDKLVSLCKRRGYIYPSSEIYGGIGSCWDYGPLGAELKRNLKNAWWSDIVQSDLIGPDHNAFDIVPVDCTIIMHPKVWEASGHLAGFNDPMRKCTKCGHFVRADHLWDILAQECKWLNDLIQHFEPVTGRYTSETLLKWARGRGKKLAPHLALVRNPEVTLSWIATRIEGQPDAPPDLQETVRYLATEQLHATGLQDPCPLCGGELSEPQQVSLMFQSHTGLSRDADSIVYLRPETAQGIFTQFWNVVDTSRVKVPFGIAQEGKAFRNEVTPRNFTFRSREFEQMEIEFFIRPEQADEWYAYWRDSRYEWWQSVGLAGDNLQLREHDKDELAHYARDGAGTSDIEYRFPFTAPGFGELEGVAHRTDYDLRQHAEHCGKGEKLMYRDPVSNEKFFPHVIEPSAGADRGTLALLCEAFTPTPDRAGSKYVMNFTPRMAPIKAAVFPLVNKDGMPEVAEKLYKDLRRKHIVQMDVKQSIGKRYARMDEAGTPFCFTIDGDTLTDRTVTVRDRDTAGQHRIALDQVEAFLAEKIG
jgi:glycyl-tRNA synthetase